MFSLALIFERHFKFFDDGLGLRRSGGLGFSQSGSFFSMAQQEFKLSGTKLLDFDSEEPPDEQIDFSLSSAFSRFSSSFCAFSCWFSASFVTSSGTVMSMPIFPERIELFYL